MEVKQPQGYRVRLAFDHYSVGQLIYPTGLWRSRLVQFGFIEEHRPEQSAEQQPEQPGVVAGSEQVERKKKHRKGNHVVESAL